MARSPALEANGAFAILLCGRFAFCVSNRDFSISPLRTRIDVFCTLKDKKPGRAWIGPPSNLALTPLGGGREGGGGTSVCRTRTEEGCEEVGGGLHYGHNCPFGDNRLHWSDGQKCFSLEAGVSGSWIRQMKRP